MNNRNIFQTNESTPRDILELYFQRYALLAHPRLASLEAIHRQLSQTLPHNYYQLNPTYNTGKVFPGSETEVRRYREEVRFRDNAIKYFCGIIEDLQNQIKAQFFVKPKTPVVYASSMYSNISNNPQMVLAQDTINNQPFTINRKNLQNPNDNTIFRFYNQTEAITGHKTGTYDLVLFSYRVLPREVLRDDQLKTVLLNEWGLRANSILNVLPKRDLINLKDNSVLQLRLLTKGDISTLRAIGMSEHRSEREALLRVAGLGVVSDDENGEDTNEWGESQVRGHSLLNQISNVSETGINQLLAQQRYHTHEWDKPSTSALPDYIPFPSANERVPNDTPPNLYSHLAIAAQNNASQQSTFDSSDDNGTTVRFVGVGNAHQKPKNSPIVESVLKRKVENEKKIQKIIPLSQQNTKRLKTTIDVVEETDDQKISRPVGVNIRKNDPEEEGCPLMHPISISLTGRTTQVPIRAPNKPKAEQFFGLTINEDPNNCTFPWPTPEEEPPRESRNNLDGFANGGGLLQVEMANGSNAHVFNKTNKKEGEAKRVAPKTEVTEGQMPEPDAHQVVEALSPTTEDEPLEEVGVLVIATNAKEDVSDKGEDSD